MEWTLVCYFVTKLLYLLCLIQLNVFVFQITNPELPQEKLLDQFANIAGFFTVSSRTGQVSIIHAINL
jgi:hypothetical protein